jgi:DNA-binding MarR family transcriptional regulator
MEETLTPETLAAWPGLLFTETAVVSALEKDMLEQHDLPITWFDLLSRLARSDERRLRMHEIEGASLFTRSGITRLADRLSEAGLVRRERSAEDRRGVYLAITEIGLAKIDAVWDDHQRSIQEHFGQYLNSKDIAAIRKATEKILKALNRTEPLNDE